MPTDQLTPDQRARLDTINQWLARNGAGVIQLRAPFLADDFAVLLASHDARGERIEVLTKVHLLCERANELAAERIEALEGALAPFALAAQVKVTRGIRRERYMPADDDVVPAGPIRWGALRKAANALAQSPSAPQGEGEEPAGRSEQSASELADRRYDSLKAGAAAAVSASTAPPTEPGGVEGENPIAPFSNAAEAVEACLVGYLPKMNAEGRRGLSAEVTRIAIAAHRATSPLPADVAALVMALKQALAEARDATFAVGEQHGEHGAAYKVDAQYERGKWAAAWSSLDRLAAALSQQARASVEEGGRPGVSEYSIARIIAPGCNWDNERPGPYKAMVLAKAQEILALFPTQAGTGEGDG